MKTGFPRHLMMTWGLNVNYAPQQLLYKKNITNIFALGYCTEIDLDFGLRKDICGGGHVD